MLVSSYNSHDWSCFNQSFSIYIFLILLPDVEYSIEWIDLLRSGYNGPQTVCLKDGRLDAYPTVLIPQTAVEGGPEALYPQTPPGCTGVTATLTWFSALFLPRTL